MAEQLSGQETEYAFTILGLDGGPLDPADYLSHLLESVARSIAHLRDRDSCGMFLANGARLYIDCGLHPEMSTPECANPWDAVRYILAGERMLSDAAAGLMAGMPEIADIVLSKCNVDYEANTTWGCHESYLYRANPVVVPPQIIPHLVSRIIYTGCGGFITRPLRTEFTLSPRVCHLQADISHESTHSRGIFHTKDEPLSAKGWHRLHILCGESLCSHIAMWLKVATTAMIVALIDAEIQPANDVALASPLKAMRAFASDPNCRVRADTVNGVSVSALDIQRHYLSIAEAHSGRDFMPPWAPEACRRWREMLDRLEKGPQTVATTLDWAIKRELFAQHARRHGVAWDTPPRRTRAAIRAAAGFRQGLTHELYEIDMRFGQLTGHRGIFTALDAAGVLDHRVPGVDNIEHAMQNPPAVGRARIRGECIRRVSGDGHRYTCAWEEIRGWSTGKVLDLRNPFATEEKWLDPPAPNTAGMHEHMADLIVRMEGRRPGRQMWLHRRPSGAALQEAASQGASDVLRPGDRVILGRHEAIDGNDNWTSEMEQYVGRAAVITRLGPQDRSACPTVRVDIDGGRWAWRTRNLRPAPDEWTPF